MNDIISYLFSTLPGIVLSVEFATVIAGLSLVAIVSLIMLTFYGRR